jgi:hypothetical protein
VREGRGMMPDRRRPSLPFDPRTRGQTKDGICEYLGRISHATYDAWQAKGLVPGPIPGTNRYDVKAHDHLLDIASSLIVQAGRKLSPLEEFEARDARAA